MLQQNGVRWHIPTQALMEEMSKPKRAPPIVPKPAKTCERLLVRGELFLDGNKVIRT